MSPSSLFCRDILATGCGVQLASLRSGRDQSERNVRNLLTQNTALNSRVTTLEDDLAGAAREVRTNRIPPVHPSFS